MNVDHLLIGILIGVLVGMWLANATCTSRKKRPERTYQDDLNDAAEKGPDRQPIMPKPGETWRPKTGGGCDIQVLDTDDFSVRLAINGKPAGMRSKRGFMKNYRRILTVDDISNSLKPK